MRYDQAATLLSDVTGETRFRSQQSANTPVELLPPELDTSPIQQVAYTTVSPHYQQAQAIVPYTPLPPPPLETPSPLPDAVAGEPQDAQVIPVNFSPWWSNIVTTQFRPGAPQSLVDVNMLIQETLENSSQVRIINDDPIIAETAITQAMAEFDPKLFIESKFNRISIPSSSTLDTGTNFSRLRENDWNSNFGVRRKNLQGGEIELSQQFGMNTSNSIFFVPPNQGDARLTLSFNQPLLNGRGEAYNESLIVLAELNTDIASDRTQAALQDHLLNVTEAYWELYLNRVLFLQKQKHLQDGLQILTYLEKRYNIDSLQSQIARARAAVARRRSELIRAEASVRNSETRLRALVNSPQMDSRPNLELISMQQPVDVNIPVTIEDAVATALECRSEVDIASREIQAARVRLGVACNDLLPKLDLVLETYLSGLKGDFDVSRAWVDQFSVGEPSYTAGIVFEVPLYRQQARSRHLQRTVELRRLISKFEFTVDNLRAEVETAVRYVKTANRNLQSQYQSLIAANADVEFLQRRWEMLPGLDRSSSFLLEDLIDAQDRRAETEHAFATAQVDHVMSLTKLNRATGTILRQEQLNLPSDLDPMPEEPVLSRASDQTIPLPPAVQNSQQGAN
ncbi:TolC family protein [Gimesia sp.]|uniref:TolC family protein n=1 Tax=Gimesia sp. TaxID=2024833 RepID=UPI003A916138